MKQKLVTKKNQTNKFLKGDTRMGVIEKRYGLSFGVRSDMKLSTYLKMRGYRSLSRILSVQQ